MAAAMTTGLLGLAPACAEPPAISQQEYCNRTTVTRTLAIGGKIPVEDYIDGKVRNMAEITLEDVRGDDIFIGVKNVGHERMAIYDTGEPRSWGIVGSDAHGNRQALYVAGFVPSGNETATLTTMPYRCSKGDEDANQPPKPA